MLLTALTLCSLSFASAVAAQNTSDLSWVPFDQSQFTNTTTLDTNGIVQLFWSIGNDYSTYGIASRSNGYLALGFSETGAMTGADMAIAYAHENGSFLFENRHATGFVTPQVSLDQTVNMRFLGGNQTNGVTAFVFEKKNTAACFQTQDDVMTDSWQWFIYAFSDQNIFAQHKDGNMGKQYVKLGTGNTVSLNTARTPTESVVQNYTVVQGEVSIPTADTTYCYTLHKMPAGKKNFWIGERPVSSSPLLHHLVLYGCYNLDPKYLEMIGQEPNCNYMNFSNPCNGFVTEWAPGMSARTFEPGYGKPFGEDYYEYAMLETHYNNPEGIAGEKDSAEYTFLWTDQQVATEIGTLTLGDLQVEGWFLEPGQPLVSHSTVCTPECTDKWPSEGITAVSVFHHMHYRGRNAQVQIIRNGTEIAPLSTLRNFEYGYQFSKSLNNIQLLPGDQLITTCQYDTMNDTQPVPGGLPSQDEMCFAWVDYYPANNILACTQYDLGSSPANPMNGTAAICMASNETIPDIYPSKFLNSTYTHLPVAGENCTADVPAQSGGSTILKTCPDTDVCFSLNVPAQSASTGSGDIFFQLSAPTTYSWVALAQGTMMSNANMFIMYSSADGKNVTLSPRSTSGHVMPTHDTAADFTLLAGSGIADGKMTANVRCKNCDTWSKSSNSKRSLSLKDTSSNWLYAHLQGASLNSDDLNAAITQHDGEGNFQWDMTKATGGSDANPFLASGSMTTSSSTTSKTSSHNTMIKAHGSLAAIAFVAIMPAGAILVRLTSINSLAWIHGVTQVFGYAIFIAAAGMGISVAKDNSYLDKPHAIIGIILLGILAVMPVVGVIHHDIYKKVQKRTVWTYGHLFTGRAAIILGMINGGLGLQLAKADTTYIVVYSVFAGLVGVVYLGAIVFGELKRGGGSRPTVRSESNRSEGKRLRGEDSSSTGSR